MLDRRSYTQKLIGALDHPDRETVMRASKVLGDRGDREAAGALAAALRRYWREPYVAAAIVRALAHLDDDAARAAVREALGHESFIVRKEAAIAFQQAASAAGKGPAREG
jgi:HEAT repeat protein